MWPFWMFALINYFTTSNKDCVSAISINLILKSPNLSRNIDIKWCQQEA